MKQFRQLIQIERLLVLKDARHSDIRRGGTTAGLVITLAVISACATAALVITPRMLDASTGGLPAAQAAESERHQQVIEMIAALLGRSHMVLAIQSRTATPFYEVVIWLEDAENRGVIDAHEIAVISHSAQLQTVMLHTLAPTPPEDSLAEQLGLDAKPQDHRPAELAFTPSDFAQVSFGTAWRNRNDGQSRVLAGNVSDLRIAAVETKDARSLLEVSLTWTAESVDGSDTATVLCDVQMRHQAMGTRH